MGDESRAKLSPKRKRDGFRSSFGENAQNPCLRLRITLRVWFACMLSTQCLEHTYWKGCQCSMLKDEIVCAAALNIVCLDSFKYYPGFLSKTLRT